MSRFLDTRGQPTLGIGICDRCRRKFPLAQLMADVNSPGLRVCADDRDDYDPYRLPPPDPDRIHLEFARPDDPLVVSDSAAAVAAGFAGWMGIRGIGAIGIGLYPK